MRRSGWKTVDVPRRGIRELPAVSGGPEATRAHLPSGNCPDMIGASRLAENTAAVDLDGQAQIGAYRPVPLGFGLGGHVGYGLVRTQDQVVARTRSGSGPRITRT
jgi:hypothetical protein